MYHTQSNSSFSMLFSMSNGDGAFDDGEMYSMPHSSSVDCTLSLGTPSTRLTTNDDNRHEKQRSPFGWNILPSKHSPKPSAAAAKSHLGGSSGNASSGGDPLLARRCANCDTTSTPLWRNGPRGPKSLCNACGIRFKKEERRATAAAASSNGGATAHMQVDSQYVINNNNWVQPQKMPYYSSSTYANNDFQYVEEYDHHWRFNVTDRPSLVHDFTR